MGIPTAAEEAIYKSKVRTYQVRVQVEIDATVFTSPWSDDFNDGTIDSDRWQQFLPEGWGSITESGGVLTVDAGDEAVAYPPYVISKNGAGSMFPTENNDFTLTAVIRFPVVTGYGVQFRVLGLGRTIFEVEANAAQGLNVKLDETVIGMYGIDTGWHTWVLEYVASTNTYTVKKDAVTVDSAVIDELPVQITIGNSAVNQGDAGYWTKIAVDSITITGTTESSSTPAWATPFTEDGITWSYLPTQTEGQINSHKNNNVDRGQVTALNQDNASTGIYLSTNFYNKRIRVKSRVGDDAGNWTGWKTRFRGVITEPRFDVRGGESVLVLDCQDERRYRLGREFVIRSYGDFDSPVQGIVGNQTVAGIVADLFIQAGLGAGDYQISGDANGTLKPKTFNVIDVAAGDAVAELVESVIWTWYVNPDDGVIQVGPLDWADGAAPDYTLRTSEEVEQIRWAKDALNAVAQSVVAAQNTAGTDIALSYPASPIPPDGRVDRFHTVAAQSFDDLEDNDIPKDRWKRMNRAVGSIEVTMSCQNWPEHDLHLAVEDTAFLGFSASRVWVVDGWREQWNGQEYTTTVQLADPDFVEIIREGLAG